MALQDLLRGPASVLALSASYVVGRSAADRPVVPERGLRRLSASLERAAMGAAAAIRIGRQVRNAPVLRSRPSLLARPDELIPVCTLMSDTHVIAPGASLCELDSDPGQWPWREMPSCEVIAAGLGRVLEHARHNAPNTVIWCGDEVDTGDPAEWQQWRQVVDSVPRLMHRLVPGNHDICFNRPHDADYTLSRRAARETAYQQHAGRLADFPIADTLITDAGAVTLVLLDSCRHRSTHILSNAVGRFDDDQLDELERVLDAVSGPLLCISHHHVWRDGPFLMPDAWYNTVVDADRMAAILGDYRQRAPGNHVMVCHGHRHALSAGVIGEPGAEISVIGLPSTTLGDKSIDGMLDGVLRYAIAGLRRDGTWAVALRPVGELAQPGEPQRARPATPPSAALRALAVIDDVPGGRLVP
ncbi:MAG TPA: metallophosphoesterase [Kofleriaceae bacterium]|nr:metallophosphoesterase [Kofleriaceae bacterium]